MTLCLECNDQASRDADLTLLEQLREKSNRLQKEIEVRLITNTCICDCCGHAWELSESEKTIVKAQRKMLLDRKKGYFI